MICTHGSASALESLEGRTLFDGGFFGQVDYVHIMNVEGGGGNDNIYVEFDGYDVVAYVNGWETNRMAGWWCTVIGVHGRVGNDNILVAHGQAIPTYIYGDDGDDTMSGGAWTGESFYGGAGRDTIDYSDRWGGVNVSLDNVANDGQWGGAEGDNVHTDVEVVSGGHANDSLVGSWGNDTFFGNDGNDTVAAGWGNDSLSGGNGNDVLIGDDGNDTMMPGYGRDTMFGGNGWDDADYRDRWSPVNVSIGWGADDGEAGENDSVLPDIEAVWGGHGNDKLIGSAGDNALFGINGDDTLIGSDGNDWLYGWYGNDLLIGGNGTNWMNGEQDNDTVVAVGGSQSDTLYGGIGLDTFWADAEWTENVADADWSSELMTGHVSRVTSFMTYHYGNGTNVAVGRDANGEDLLDPIGGSNYVDFANRPLFNWSGPSTDDIDQDNVGDCYFLATLGSMARTNPDFIRRNITELGDGSYAIRFIRSGVPTYVRVDADLPTDSKGNPFFAGLGTGNSLWATLMEKAWSFFRNNDSNYQSAAGGWPSEVYTAFGVSSTSHGRNIFGNWEGGAGALTDYVRNELWSGKSVTVCTPSSGGSLVGSHCYSVESVYWNGSWRIVLRNPWGPDNTGGNPYVDLDANTLAASIDEVDSAFVW